MLPRQQLRARFRPRGQGVLDVEAIRQHFRNVPISILGRFRSRGLDGVRSDRDQELHEVLGPTAVRIVFGHQHNRFAKHAHRHDVQFVSDHFRTIRHGMEVRAELVVDIVLRGRRHRSPAVQLVPVVEKRQTVNGPRQNQAYIRIDDLQVAGESVGTARHRHAAAGETLRDCGATEERGIRHHRGRRDGDTAGHIVDEVRDDRHIQAERVQDAREGTRFERRPGEERPRDGTSAAEGLPDRVGRGSDTGRDLVQREGAERRVQQDREGDRPADQPGQQEEGLERGGQAEERGQGPDRQHGRGHGTAAPAERPPVHTGPPEGQPAVHGHGQAGRVQSPAGGHRARGPGGVRQVQDPDDQTRVRGEHRGRRGHVVGRRRADRAGGGRDGGEEALDDRPAEAEERATDGARGRRAAVPVVTGRRGQDGQGGRRSGEDGQGGRRSGEDGQGGRRSGEDGRRDGPGTEGGGLRGGRVFVGDGGRSRWTGENGRGQKGRGRSEEKGRG